MAMMNSVQLLLTVATSLVCNALQSSRFFAVHQDLFLSDGSKYWQVTEPGKLTSKIQPDPPYLNITLTGPFKLLPRKSSHFNYSTGQLKFAFTVKNGNCTFLFLTNRRLNYQSWLLLKQSNVSDNKSSKQSFKLKNISATNGSCFLPIESTGNLRSMPLLGPLFATNQTVTSVLSDAATLYFVAFDFYIKVDLHIGKVHTADCVQCVQLNTSFPSGETNVLFEDRLLVQRGLHTKVCQLNSLYSMQYSNCVRINLIKNTKTGKSAHGLKSKIIEVSSGFQGASNDHEEGTTEVMSMLKSNALLIMLVLVTAAMLILTCMYIVAANCLCKDSLAPEPSSTKNNLHSASFLLRR